MGSVQGPSSIDSWGATPQRGHVRTPGWCNEPTLLAPFRSELVELCNIAVLEVHYFHVGHDAGCRDGFRERNNALVHCER